MVTTPTTSFNASVASPRPKRPSNARPLPMREYLTRRELLALVPLSMSSITNLEKAGVFPARFKIAPTSKVAWVRREVVQFMESRARKRIQHSPVK